MSDPAVPPPPPPDAPPPPPAMPGPYPTVVDCERQPEYHRLLPFVKWLLALPHYIVLAVLYLAAIVAVVIAFFAVLFTGRYPRGLFDFITGTMRWGWNVLAYVMLLTDKYPPFSLAADPSYPALFALPYPEEGIDRWRPLVQWLLVLPFAIVAALLQYVSGAVALIGAFVILFTKELPAGMFKLILIPQRWYLRAMAYQAFLVDRYPPFEWDE